MNIQSCGRFVGVLCFAVSAFTLFFSGQPARAQEKLVSQNDKPALAIEVSDISLSVWDAVKSGDCKDRMTFLSSSEVLVESGSHAAIKTYELERQRRSDFYILRFNTKSRNKELNCAGNRGVVAGRDHGVFIKFNASADEMRFYSEANNDANFNLSFKKR